jgi:hypothetical protein
MISLIARNTEAQRLGSRAHSRVFLHTSVTAFFSSFFVVSHSLCVPVNCCKRNPRISLARQNPAKKKRRRWRNARELLCPTKYTTEECIYIYILYIYVYIYIFCSSGIVGLSPGAARKICFLSRN